MGASARPVVRAWTLTGDVVADRAALTDLRRAVTEHVEQMPGYLGKYLLVDASRSEMLGLSLWEDAEAREASEAAVARLAAERRTEGAEAMVEARYDVVVSRPEPSFAGVASPAAEPPRRVARVINLEGGDLGQDAVIEALATYAVNFVALAPGCVSTFVAVDRSRPAVLAMSLWASAEAEQRSAGSNSPLVQSVVELTHATGSRIQVYDVLAARPMLRSYP